MIVMSNHLSKEYWDSKNVKVQPMRLPDRISYNRAICEQSGGEYIRAYRRKDGVLVHGYCKGIKYISAKQFREARMIREE